VRFFLGTHQPHWLRDEAFIGVDLFISRRRLATYAKLPPAETSFALDSGGFTELQMFGRWTISTNDFADEVKKYIRFYGKRLRWAAPQDWMCEPIVLAGGAAARGVVFAGTGLSVLEHQRRTVKNFLDLRKLLGERVIPVLQGWKLTDYWRCQELYEKAGIRLQDERVVGVGTVCRRQNTAEATTIMTTLAGSGLRLHGFGFKKLGLKNCHQLLASADSTAWSDTARQNPVLLPGHDKPGDRRKRGHINCANCPVWALQWRRELLNDLEDRNAA